MHNLPLEALLELVKQHVNEGCIDAAVATALRAVALGPGEAEAHFLLGAAYQLKGMASQAIDSYQRALALRPGHPVIHHAITLLEQTGEYEAIVPLLSGFLRQAPDQAWAWSDLCLYLTKAGQTVLGIDAGRMAIRLAPDLAPAHWNLSRALLRSGHFREGWQEYEWRQRLDAFAVDRFVTDLPAWDGRPYTGKTLLVICEQGAGDTFQFIRFIAQAKALGGQVMVAADPSLLRVLESVAGIDHLVSRAVLQEHTGQVDCYAYLLSLPYLLRLDGVPPTAAYISPSPASCARLRQVLAGLAPEGLLKVGIVWAGNPHHANDRYRSLPLQVLAPLAGLPGIHFFSLQKGEAARQCQALAGGLQLTDLSDQLHDFVDTAAVVSLLDLLISVDTSVAHLGGALGKPVWTLLPEKDVDWRWLDGRDDTSWYATMRLLRQTADRSQIGWFLKEMLEQWQSGQVQYRDC